MSRVAITDLTHRYADAVVRRDADQWASTWAPDAVWELGKGRRVEGREAILALWNSAMDGFKAVVQNVVNSTATSTRTPAPGRVAATSSSTGAAPTTRRGSCSPTTTTSTHASTASGSSPAANSSIQYGGPPDLSAPFQNAWG